MDYIIVYNQYDEKNERMLLEPYKRKKKPPPKYIQISILILKIVKVLI